MFDQEPDGPLHGECAAEIHRLEAELAAARKLLEVARRKMAFVLRDYPDDKETAKWLAAFAVEPCDCPSCRCVEYSP